MSDNIIQVNQDFIHTELKNLVRTKLFYLNSTAPLCGGIYSCAVDIYSFIQK